MLAFLPALGFGIQDNEVKKLKPISNGEFVKLLISGKTTAHYDVAGPVDLSKVTFSKSVNITDCQIKEGIKFLECTFKDGLSFVENTIDKRLLLDHVVINQDLTFSGSFPCQISINTASVGALLSLGDSVFNNGIWIRGSKINNLSTWGSEFGNPKAVISNGPAKGRFRIADTTFQKPVAFNDSTYWAGASFSRCSFEKGLAFDRSTIGYNVTLNNCTISGSTSLTDTQFLKVNSSTTAEPDAGVRFLNCQVHGDLLLDNINPFDEPTPEDLIPVGDENFDPAFFTSYGIFAFATRPRVNDGFVNFEGSTFDGMVSLYNSSLRALVIGKFGDTYEPGRRLRGGKPIKDRKDQKVPERATQDQPCVFKAPLIFDKVNLVGVSISNAHIKDTLLFSDARVQDKVYLEGSLFFKKVDCTDTKFAKISLRNTRFFEGIELSIDQLIAYPPLWRPYDAPRSRVLDARSTVWRDLERIFHSAGETRAEGEANFMRRYFAVDANYAEEEDVFTNRLGLYYWGYGHRPMWVLSWFLSVSIVFGALYGFNRKKFDLTKFSDAKGDSEQGYVDKAPNAFTVLRTAFFKNMLKPSFGGGRIKVKWLEYLTYVHCVMSVILLVTLLAALANTSPILHDLVSKVIP